MIALILEQILNGLQLGSMLFLVASGLTLVFGVMGIINLAHGSFYMLGAYLAATAIEALGSFLAGIVIGTAAVALLGALVEKTVIRKLYGHHPLAQVLATFGLILFFNALVIVIWGTEPRYIPTPQWLAHTARFSDAMSYPMYRLAVTSTGMAIALGLYAFLKYTRTGLLIQAGSTNRAMVEALGVDINRLYTLVFGLGAALAAFAGIMTGPILSIQPGMGEPMLVLALVVIVIGGVGSIKGAFMAALLIGVADTFARAFLPSLLGYTTGPALASMFIYLLMAIVLFYRPNGLFGSNEVRRRLAR